MCRPMQDTRQNIVQTWKSISTSRSTKIKFQISYGKTLFRNHLLAFCYVIQWNLINDGASILILYRLTDKSPTQKERY